MEDQGNFHSEIGGLSRIRYILLTTLFTWVKHINQRLDRKLRWHEKEQKLSK